MIRTLLAVAGIGTSVLLAPLAHADNSDAYISFLNGEGVHFGTDLREITMGQAVCQVLHNNPSYDSSAMTDAVATGEGISGDDAALVVGSAVRAFCPDLVSQLT